MMKEVVAVRYDRALSSGRNRPLLVAGDAEGESVELVAKFEHRCERRVNALIAEALAAMFAADLDLPVPEPFLVRLDPDLSLLLQESLTGWPKDDVLAAYGSRRLPPAFGVLPQGKAPPATQLAVAAEILAYDVLIDNSDRLPKNPNCLTDGRSLAIIDHELAFPSFVLGARDPWENGALAHLGLPPTSHLFYDALKGSTLDLNRLSGAVEAVNDERLNQYLQALPTEWLGATSEHGRMLERLRAVRGHMSDIVAQIALVLR